MYDIAKKLFNILLDGHLLLIVVYIPPGVYHVPEVIEINQFNWFSIKKWSETEKMYDKTMTKK